MGECNVLMSRRAFFIVGALILLIWPVISVDPLFRMTNGVAFGYNDSTSGHGSFAGYNNLIYERQEQIKRTDSGSGAIYRDWSIGSYRSFYADPDSYNFLLSFGILANSIMYYAPQTMTVGTGYYASHPVQFDSRLGDRIETKNYPAETSMIHEIEYAAAIREKLRSGTTTVHQYSTNTTDIGTSYISLSENVADGITHMGVMHSDTHDQHYDNSAWSIAKSELDETYSGTFDLNTTMRLVWPMASGAYEDSWLPCCSGGWNDMSLYDKKGFGRSTKGIFDCTCCRWI